MFSWLRFLPDVLPKRGAEETMWKRRITIYSCRTWLCFSSCSRRSNMLEGPEAATRFKVTVSCVTRFFCSPSGVEHAYRQLPRAPLRVELMSPCSTSLPRFPIIACIFYRMLPAPPGEGCGGLSLNSRAPVLGLRSQLQRSRSHY